MPRLFWKLFLTLWGSIMAFAIVTAWVNASLAREEIPDPPEVAIERGVDRAERMLRTALNRDGEAAARQRLRELPRPLRHHLYLVDAQGRELLGRERRLERFGGDGIRERRRFQDRSGKDWTLVVVSRSPPWQFLEPGRRGIVMRLLALTVFSAVVSFLLARYLARPLERIGATGRQLAAGDLGARVGAPLDRRRDEFGELARDLDAMAERLDAAQRASHRLLRDVSHELRSPLARQRVALELARKRAGTGISPELDRIERESERLETLVDQVLGLLRESSGSASFAPESFDLAELLADLADVVAYERPEGAPGIETRLEAPLPVTADRELIWRAVENLLRNAVLHSSEAEPISLAAKVLEPGQIGVRVRDRGPGVPPSQLERIFDPFTRVDDARDRSRGGHGLGLAIAAAAIRRHGGTIAARNRDGGGLEIRVELPIGA